MSETIYKSDFTKYLPQPLTHDPQIVALAKTISEGFWQFLGEQEMC